MDSSIKPSTTIKKYAPKHALPLVTTELTTHEKDLGSTSDFIVKDTRNDQVMTQSQTIALLVNAVQELDEKVEKLKRGYFAVIEMAREKRPFNT